MCHLEQMKVSCLYVGLLNSVCPYKRDSTIYNCPVYRGVSLQRCVLTEVSLHLQRCNLIKLFLIEPIQDMYSSTAISLPPDYDYQDYCMVSNHHHSPATPTES